MICCILLKFVLNYCIIEGKEILEKIKWKKVENILYSHMVVK